jgi:hypothetical protein
VIHIIESTIHQNFMCLLSIVTRKLMSMLNFQVYEWLRRNVCVGIWSHGITNRENKEGDQVLSLTLVPWSEAPPNESGLVPVPLAPSINRRLCPLREVLWLTWNLKNTLTPDPKMVLKGSEGQFHRWPPGGLCQRPSTIIDMGYAISVAGKCNLQIPVSASPNPSVNVD